MKGLCVRRKQSAAIDATALDALAWGLSDAGVGVVTGYPGFHAHELVERCGGVISVNERTAYAVAWGASLVGARAAVAFKNVGLNDAADAFLGSMRLRTSAGLVVVVFDDLEVAGSQCRQDSRPYFDLVPGQLWLEPTSARHAYWCARTAPDMAERFGAPLVIRVTNALLRSHGGLVRKAAPVLGRTFRRNPELTVAHPVNARQQAIAAARRQHEIAAFVKRLVRPTPDTASLVIRVGACGPVSSFEVSRGSGVCPIWTYPLPEAALRQRLKHADKVEVLELGSSFVREKVKALASGIEVVGRDPAADMDHSQSYRINGDFGSLYRALRSFPNRVVCGDLGSFTMDAARTVDACLCYGASVAVGVGCSLGQHPGSVFAVTGDAAFLHTGQVCIEEARKRAAQLVVIILDNGSAKSTGGQVVPGSIRLPPDLPVVTMEHSMATAEMYRSALARLCCESGVTVLHVRC